MSKRELSRLGGTVDVEGSRPKRRRDTTNVAESSPEVDITMEEPSEEETRYNGSNNNVSGRTVKEQGHYLLHTVKEAKTKDGRLLSTVFLTKPPRKVYPDYYKIIQKPIALDDIRKRLDTNAYHSLQAVRTDFELLFNNALEYNLKDSVIWKDAKDMLKLVQKTYEKLAPGTELEDASDDDDDEKKGKSKGPSLNRLIKTRLQKLIEKTDKDGRVMSAEFMQLPNKKQWAIYYKQIKNPQCIENIFRKIKRKEYHSSAAFAADVERVFSNAMTFNQDHTTIWEDALALRNYFRELMSDLPTPYTLPEYSIKVVTNKIRIKPPAATQVDSAATKPEPSSSTLLLRVPPAANAAATKSSQLSASSAVKTKSQLPPSTPAAPPAPSTSVTPASAAPVKLPIAPQPQRPTQQSLAPVIQALKSTSATPQPANVAQKTFTYSHYSHPYQSVPPVSTPSASPTVVVTQPTPTTSNSPAPAPIHPNHQIKFVKVKIQPQGRLLWLDRREGVKTWAMRLAQGETGLQIDDVVFVGDEEGEESSDDEEEEEEGEDDDMEVDGSASPTKNGKLRKGKASVRRSQRTAAVTTRTTRSAVAKIKIEEKKKEVERVEEVLLKLNGVLVKGKQDTTRQWNVSLPVGTNILEVGEKGGLMWKVHVERIADI